jgi:16S rRNA (guanine527-N7)-methyltransferase
MNDVITDRYRAELTELFSLNKIDADKKQVDLLARYADLVVCRNEAVNLISRKGTEFIIENHIFICALLSKYIPDNARYFLDIGTGGGFPGIPLAIMRPELKGVLADSILKKTESVKLFIEALELNNIKSINCRVEEGTFKKEYPGSFDLIVSRATVPLALLVKYSLPVIKSSAALVSMKGGCLSAEIEEALKKYSSKMKNILTEDMTYFPSNINNEKEKKIIKLELMK